MSKKTKVIYRKALYQIQGIPPSLWIGADKFSKTIHKDSTTLVQLKKELFVAI